MSVSSVGRETKPSCKDPRPRGYPREDLRRRVSEGRATLISGRSLCEARAYGSARDPRSRPHRQSGAPRLVRGGVARAAGGRRSRRLRRPHTRWPLQRRGTRLAPGPRAPALEGAGSHRRGGTPPRSVGRRPDSRRGRAGSARLRRGRSKALRCQNLLFGCVGPGSRARARAWPAQGRRLLAYVDLSEGMKVDTAWFRAAGMRASESHRVVFEGTPVLAVLGEPGELVREPYFSRDAIRTAVTWAGISDTALEAALDVLAAKAGDGEPDDVVSLAAGRMLAARGTIDRWLAYAADRADADPASLPGISTQLRESVSRSCREILDEAARAVGSHPFAVSGPWTARGGISNSSSSSTVSRPPWYAAGGRPSRTGERERATRTRVLRGTLRKVK